MSILRFRFRFMIRRSFLTRAPWCPIPPCANVPHGTSHGRQLFSVPIPAQEPSWEDLLGKQ